MSFIVCSVLCLCAFEPLQRFRVSVHLVLCAEISVPFSKRAHDMRVHLYTAREDGEAREAGSDE